MPAAWYTMRDSHHVFLIVDWRRQTRNNSVPPELEAGSRERGVMRYPERSRSSTGQSSHEPSLTSLRAGAPARWRTFPIPARRIRSA